MQEKFQLYDEICETGIKWLLFNFERAQLPICIKTIGINNKEDLWFCCITRSFDTFINTPTYFTGSWIKFLILKYIKGFKFLHYTFKLKNKFIIDAEVFEIEIVKTFNKFPYILGDIYDEYYKRSKK